MFPAQTAQSAGHASRRVVGDSGALASIGNEDSLFLRPEGLGGVRRQGAFVVACRIVGTPVMSETEFSVSCTGTHPYTPTRESYAGGRAFALHLSPFFGENRDWAERECHDGLTCGKSTICGKSVTF